MSAPQQKRKLEIKPTTLLTSTQNVPPSTASIELEDEAAPKEPSRRGRLRNVPKRKFIGECVCGNPVTVEAGRGITLYRTIRFKERIQCIGPSEFTGPRESVNVIPNWEECITGNYWAHYTHWVALGDAAHDAGTKLLPRKCRISTMPVSIGGSENPGNRICAIFLPPQYSC